MKLDYTRVIGIGGERRHGKDTLAEALLDYAKTMGYQTHRRAYADPLKEEVAQFLAAKTSDLPLVAQMNHTERTELFLECLHGTGPYPKEQFRLLMQWWGTEFRRKFFGEDYWVDQAREFVENVEKIGIASRAYQLVVIPDVRFPAGNEGKMVRDFGGKLVKVLRPSVVNNDPHPSEWDLQSFTGWDHVFRNETTVSALREAGMRWLYGISWETEYPVL